MVEIPITPPAAAVIALARGADPQAVEAWARGLSPAPRAGAVYAGVPDDKVLAYLVYDEASGAERALAAAPFAVDAATRWGARVYRQASSANVRPVRLDDPEVVVAHTGLFAMHAPERQAEMLARGEDAAKVAIERAPGLLSANFHGSLDGEVVVNFGFWESRAAFEALAANPPFQDAYWADLADNEPGLYERVAAW